MKLRSPLERLRYLGKACQFGAMLMAVLGAIYIAVRLYGSYLQVQNFPAQTLAGYYGVRLPSASFAELWPYYLGYYSGSLEPIFPIAFYALMLYAAGCLIEHFFPLPARARKEVELDDFEMGSQNGTTEDEEEYERVVIVPLSKVRN
jgi:hypothetical protein